MNDGASEREREIERWKPVVKEEVLGDKRNKRDGEITRESERERRKSVVEEEILDDKRNKRDV